MTTGGRGGTGKAVLVAVVVVGALLLIGVLSLDPRAGDPYDAASTGPEGTRGLVELIERFGGRAEVATAFPVDADIALAFPDGVPPQHSEAVEEWVAGGRTLVIADPASDLTAVADVSGSFAETVDRGDCDIPALDAVDRLALGDTPALYRYDVDADVAVCFADDDGAFVALHTVGTGRVVSLAGGEPLQNQNLDRDDNAALATALLVPRPGTRVAILADATFPGPAGPPSVAGALNRLLEEYPRVGLVLVQIGVALAVLALVSGRRLGRPVTEPQPVQIAGSSLVDAVGRLLRQRRDPEAAARILRSEARRAVAERAALPVTAPAEVLAATLAARTGRPPEESRAVLDGPPLTSDADLVALADKIDDVVEEVSHGRTP